MELAPLRKLSKTGTEMTVCPPPVFGWSTKMLDPPFALEGAE